MELKKGEKVRIKKSLKEGARINGTFINDEMEALAGSVATIAKLIDTRDGKCKYEIIEDGKIWTWDEDMFEKHYTWKKFKKCPIGTKVTFEKGEVLVKTDYKDSMENCFYGHSFFRSYEDLLNFRDNCGMQLLGKIVKIEEPVYGEVYNLQDKQEAEEMTLEEVCKALGKTIKIVKKEGK